MKRCIINVAVGAWYPRGQHRLRTSLEQDDRRCGADLLFWNCWPPGSPSHQELPFAFKSHAFRAAREAGYRQILWLDAACWAVRSLQPVWDKLDRDGFLFINNGWSMASCSSDMCLDFFDKSRNEAEGLLELTALCMGVDLEFDAAARWEADFERCCKVEKLLTGNLHNRPGHIMTDPHSGKSCGIISADPRCLRHTREQCVASWLAHRHGLVPFTTSPELVLQGAHPGIAAPPETCIQSCGL
jgi:hypothetical protein